MPQLPPADPVSRAHLNTRAAPPARHLDYPLDSRPLGPGEVHLLEPNTRHDRRSPLRPAGQAVRAARSPLQVLFTGDRYALVDRDTLTTTLAVYPDATSTQAVPAQVTAAHVTLHPQARAGLPAPTSLPPPVALSYRDDGQGGDAEAGDHVYTGVIDPHALHLSRLGVYLVDVAFRAGGTDATASLTFQYTPASDIPARFTGRVTDTVSDGSLHTVVGVDVRHPGTYIIDANLYDQAGEPLARASQRMDLDRGRQKVDLRFYGKILRDAGRPGPYVLRQLRGYHYMAGQDPDREMMPPSAGEHTTAAYRLDEFTDRPWR